MFQKAHSNDQFNLMIALILLQYLDIAGISTSQPLRRCDQSLLTMTSETEVDFGVECSAAV